MPKISANLSDELDEQLRKVADRRGISMTELLRQALSTELWLRQQAEEDSKILVESKDGETRQVVFR